MIAQGHASLKDKTSRPDSPSPSWPDSLGTSRPFRGTDTAGGATAPGPSRPQKDWAVNNPRRANAESPGGDQNAFNRAAVLKEVRSRSTCRSTAPPSRRPRRPRDKCGRPLQAGRGATQDRPCPKPSPARADRTGSATISAWARGAGGALLSYEPSADVSAPE